MFEGGGIPKGLEEIPPGPQLAAILSSIDRDALSGHDRVSLLRARARQLAYDQAAFYADVEAVYRSEAEIFENGLEAQAAASDEIRCALTLTRRGADVQLLISGDLAKRPEVAAALSAGEISLAKARIICEQVSHLPAETAEQVAVAALERASGQTTGQLSRRIKRLVIEVDPDAARERYEQAVKERRVVLEPNETGTANLRALDLPAERAASVMCRINRLAREAKSKDDPRSIDQVRADVFLDLLDGSMTTVGIGGGGVEITVELSTLVGLSERPGELNGYGPVIADIARKVAADQRNTTHRVTVTDSGRPVWTGTTRRRPTSQQKRKVENRNPTCVFPGCRIPASECDIDHLRAWAEGGATTVENLEPLCRHDHRAKHERGWTLQELAPGSYQWTSPLGHTYTTRPEPP